MGDTDVGEQPGAKERLEGFVFLFGTEAAARAWLEVGANGVGFDPAAAFDNDRTGRLRNCDA